MKAEDEAAANVGYWMKRGTCSVSQLQVTTADLDSGNPLLRSRVERLVDGTAEREALSIVTVTFDQ